MLHWNYWVLLFYIYPVWSDILWDTVLDVNDITLVNYKVIKTETTNHAASESIKSKSILTKNLPQDNIDSGKFYDLELPNKRGNPLANSDYAFKKIKSIRNPYMSTDTKITTPSNLLNNHFLKNEMGINGGPKMRKYKFKRHWCCPFMFSKKSKRNPFIERLNFKPSLPSVISHEKPSNYRELPAISLSGTEKSFFKDTEYLHKLDDPESQKISDIKDNKVKHINSPISFTAESKKEEPIPDDIMVFGGKHDGSKRWWYHEQPHDEEEIPDWVSENNVNAHSLPMSGTTKHYNQDFHEDDNGIVEPPFLKHKYVQPSDYTFFADHSYTENRKLPYYLGYNNKTGEFIVIAHSLTLPEKLINEYHHHDDFDFNLHDKQLHHGSLDKEPNYLDSSMQFSSDIPLDDDLTSRLVEPKVRHEKNQYNANKRGQIIRDTGNNISGLIGTDVILDDDVGDRSLEAVDSKENNLLNNIPDQITDNIPLNDDVATRSFTKDAPLYPQDGRYGIYPGQITVKDQYNPKSTQNVFYTANQANYYPQNADNYPNTNTKQKAQQLTQEYIEMWPNSGITYAATPAITNQQYQNVDSSSTADRSYLVPSDESVSKENVYDYTRILNKYEDNLASQDQWAPAYYNAYSQDTATTPQHYSESLYSDSTSEVPNFIVTRSDSKELQSNYHNHKQYKGDNSEKSPRYTQVQGIQKPRRYQPGLEKYARIGHEYGSNSGGHGSRDLYNANDHGKIGYGHDDHHKGYGHGGYGHDDHHKGYGHGGFGHDDHHKGYGHDDYGHGGGYGHDDHHHDGGYGHGSHGGYGKPVKTKKWEKAYHSKGYGKWGQTGNSGNEHHHNKKGHWKEDHQDHHKSKGSKIKTYSYGGKGWYKEESNGQEKGFGGKKGYHQHYDWGHDHSKSQDKKKPYHEYNTKLDGWHKEHGYHK